MGHKALFDVAFILIETAFATKTTGDFAPEMILVLHGVSLFGLLLPFQLQHTPRPRVTVGGMTQSPIVVHRAVLEKWGKVLGKGWGFVHCPYGTPVFGILWLCSGGVTLGVILVVFGSSDMLPWGA